MTELSDWKRHIYEPEKRSFEATIKSLREQVDDLKMFALNSKKNNDFYIGKLIERLAMAERILALPREATPQELELIREALKGEDHGQKTSEDNGSAADQAGTDKSARE